MSGPSMRSPSRVCATQRSSLRLAHCQSIHGCDLERGERRGSKPNEAAAPAHSGTPAATTGEREQQGRGCGASVVGRAREPSSRAQHRAADRERAAAAPRAAPEAARVAAQCPPRCPARCSTVQQHSTRADVRGRRFASIRFSEEA